MSGDKNRFAAGPGGSWYPYETVLGPLTIVSDGTAVTAICFAGADEPGDPRIRSELTDRAATQINEYAAGSRRRFELPLRPAGTAFQRAVWQALCDIPYGETRSYKQIAAAVGNPAATRAVGMANNRNPIVVVIPCHRVIGADGSLTGYGGGLDMKRRLLDLETGRLSFSFPAAVYDL